MRFLLALALLSLPLPNLVFGNGDSAACRFEDGVLGMRVSCFYERPVDGSFIADALQLSAAYGVSAEYWPAVVGDDIYITPYFYVQKQVGDITIAVELAAPTGIPNTMVAWKAAVSLFYLSPTEVQVATLPTPAESK